MKIAKRYNIGLIISAFIAIGAGALIFMVFAPRLRPRQMSKTEQFDIARGASGIAVFRKLKNRGIVGNWMLFRGTHLLGRLLYGPFKPGVYEFRFPVSYWRLIYKFCRAEVMTLTIPEGYTQREIAELLMVKLKTPDSPYLLALKENHPNYEGRLFPATYRITERDPKSIIQAMRRTFEKKTAGLNLSRDDLILASIIQKESYSVPEYQRLSGVFYNRLQSGMMLEADPTLQYVVGKIRLTREVLKSESPYNSYRYTGLPPTPISNPGRPAIQAALNPEKHGYYYFCSRRDGTHYFSKTKEEHFAAVGHFLAGRKNNFHPCPESALSPKNVAACQ